MAGRLSHMEEKSDEMPVGKPVDTNTLFFGGDDSDSSSDDDWFGAGPRSSKKKQPRPVVEKLQRLLKKKQSGALSDADFAKAKTRALARRVRGVATATTALKKAAASTTDIPTKKPAHDDHGRTEEETDKANEYFLKGGNVRPSRSNVPQKFEVAGGGFEEFNGVYTLSAELENEHFKWENEKNEIYRAIGPWQHIASAWLIGKKATPGSDRVKQTDPFQYGHEGSVYFQTTGCQTPPTCQWQQCNSKLSAKETVFRLTVIDPTVEWQRKTQQDRLKR